MRCPNITPTKCRIWYPVMHTLSFINVNVAGKFKKLWLRRFLNSEFGYTVLYLILKKVPLPEYDKCSYFLPRSLSKII